MTENINNPKLNFNRNPNSNPITNPKPNFNRNPNSNPKPSPNSHYKLCFQSGYRLCDGTRFLKNDFAIRIRNNNSIIG